MLIGDMRGPGAVVPCLNSGAHSLLWGLALAELALGSQRRAPLRWSLGSSLRIHFWSYRSGLSCYLESQHRMGWARSWLCCLRGSRGSTGGRHMPFL